MNSVFQSAIGTEFRERVSEKLSSVLRKGYVVIKDEVKSLTHFFPVAKTWKGERVDKRVDDTRMVYDATKSGLNDAV